MMKKLILSQAEVLELLKGAEVIAPGVWKDHDGGLHFSLPDILEEMKMDDTPQNRATLTTEIIERAQAEHGDKLEVVSCEMVEDGTPGTGSESRETPQADQKGDA